MIMKPNAVIPREKLRLPQTPCTTRTKFRMFQTLLRISPHFPLSPKDVNPDVVRGIYERGIPIQTYAVSYGKIIYAEYLQSKNLHPKIV